MDAADAISRIRAALSRKHLVSIYAECDVDYTGRAVSTLPRGRRLILIKGDNSISIHQNRLVRPTNYMVNTRISLEPQDGLTRLVATRTGPRERLDVRLHDILDVQCYDMDLGDDLRLSGSERDLNTLLMEDLSMIEPGLTPVNQQEHFRKGICDIIATDKDGNLVVIELKRRLADYASVTQLQRYMREVKRIKGQTPRGILMAPDIRKSARELLEQHGLEFARIDFTLTPSAKEKAEITGLQKKQKTLSHYS